MRDEQDPGVDLQEQIADLLDQVEANRAAIDSLSTRTDAVENRADKIEAQVDVDRAMIAELQADGVLSQEHAEHLEQALRTSRTIGAAIGMIVASRQVSPDEAFGILKQASQHSNRKLRDIAAELVEQAEGAEQDEPPDE
jgi:ANTAR domain-containing protein